MFRKCVSLCIDLGYISVLFQVQIQRYEGTSLVSYCQSMKYELDRGRQFGGWKGRVMNYRLVGFCVLTELISEKYA